MNDAVDYLLETQESTYTLLNRPSVQSFMERSRVDRYMEMFKDLEEHDQTIRREVKKVVQRLKREDAIIYVLRYLKYYMYESVGEEEKAEEYAKKFPYVKEMGVDSSEWGADGLDGVLQGISHFMSLGIGAIDSFRFDKQPWNDIYAKLHRIEQEWKKQFGDTIEAHEDDEIILKFPDGSAWFDVHNDVCSPDESKVMGHCGNSYNRHEDYTIYSYRTPAGKKGLWKPHLTFVVDTRDGTLIESKGKGNAKPAEKYHPHIKALIDKGLINHLDQSGTYQPENNFQIQDLGDWEYIHNLVMTRPNFLTKGALKQLINEYGSEHRDAFISEKEWETLIEVSPLSVPLDRVLAAKGADYVKQLIGDDERLEDLAKNIRGKEVLVFDGDLDDIAGFTGSDGLKNYIPYLTGDEFFDNWVPDLYWPEAENMLEALNDSQKSELLAYANHVRDEEEYPEPFQSVADLDESFVESNLDELHLALTRSYSRGYDAGADAELTESVSTYLDGLPVGWEYEHRTSDGTSQITRSIRLDGENFQGYAELDDVVKLLNTEDAFDDLDYEGLMTWFWESVMAEHESWSPPYYGFERYDEEYAAETFVSYEFPGIDFSVPDPNHNPNQAELSI